MCTTGSSIQAMAMLSSCSRLWTIRYRTMHGDLTMLLLFPANLCHNLCCSGLLHLHSISEAMIIRPPSIAAPLRLPLRTRALQYCNGQAWKLKQAAHLASPCCCMHGRVSRGLISISIIRASMVEEHGSWGKSRVVENREELELRKKMADVDAAPG